MGNCGPFKHYSWAFQKNKGSLQKIKKKKKGEIQHLETAKEVVLTNSAAENN